MGLSHKDVTEFINIWITWYGQPKDTFIFAQLNVFIFNRGEKICCPVKFRNSIHHIRPTAGDVQVS